MGGQQQWPPFGILPQANIDQSNSEVLTRMLQQSYAQNMGYATPPSQMESFNGTPVPQAVLQFAKDFVDRNGLDSIPQLIDQQESVIC